MSSSEAAPVVLVDMDNTLVNYDAEFERRWLQARPDDSADVIRSRKIFAVEKNFPQDLQPLVREIIAQPDFFLCLKPYPGALTALNDMLDAGLQVMLCTSPSLFQLETSASCKYSWVRANLGERWLHRLIITRDKTVVRGAVLVDDKPTIKGACPVPEWTQVLFTQSYNAHMNDKPRFDDWGQWRRVLAPFFPSLSL